MTLIDRNAANLLQENNKKLVGLFPKKRPVERPKTEYMVDALRELKFSFCDLGDGNTGFKMAGFMDLQVELLELMGTNPDYYSYEYCKNALTTAESLHSEDFKQHLNTYIFAPKNG
jgi:hypothetical protein